MRGVNFTRRALSSNTADAAPDFIDGLREAVASEVTMGAAGLEGVGVDISEIIEEAIDEEFNRAADRIKEAAAEIGEEIGLRRFAFRTGARLHLCVFFLLTTAYYLLPSVASG